MGTDNLFHKRKAKNAKNIQRRAVKRKAYDKILIVCEGRKTEPNYFIGVKNYYGLHTANVEISGALGSDPKSIIRFAKQRYREEKDAGDAFDKVFCVFDRDDHANYEEALADIEAAQPRGTFTLINSVPCFEYWLLLHFVHTDKPYASVPGRSAGDQVLSELVRYFPDYKKGAVDVFESLIGQLDFAKNNAARSLRQAEASGVDNPITRVHELVSYLQGIKSV